MMTVAHRSEASLGLVTLGSGINISGQSEGGDRRSREERHEVKAYLGSFDSIPVPPDALVGPNGPL